MELSEIELDRFKKFAVSFLKRKASAQESKDKVIQVLRRELQIGESLPGEQLTKYLSDEQDGHQARRTYIAEFKEQVKLVSSTVSVSFNSLLCCPILLPFFSKIKISSNQFFDFNMLQIGEQGKAKLEWTDNIRLMEVLLKLDIAEQSKAVLNDPLGLVSKMDATKLLEEKEALVKKLEKSAQFSTTAPRTWTVANDDPNSTSYGSLTALQCLKIMHLRLQIEGCLCNRDALSVDFAVNPSSLASIRAKKTRLSNKLRDLLAELTRWMSPHPRYPALISYWPNADYLAHPYLREQYISSIASSVCGPYGRALPWVCSIESITPPKLWLFDKLCELERSVEELEILQDEKAKTLEYLQRHLRVYSKFQSLLKSPSPGPALLESLAYSGASHFLSSRSAMLQNLLAEMQKATFHAAAASEIAAASLLVSGAATASTPHPSPQPSASSSSLISTPASSSSVSSSILIQSTVDAMAEAQSAHSAQPLAPNLQANAIPMSLDAPSNSLSVLEPLPPVSASTAEDLGPWILYEELSSDSESDLESVSSDSDDDS